MNKMGFSVFFLYFGSPSYELVTSMSCMEVGQWLKRFYSATGSSTLTLCRKISFVFYCAWEAWVELLLSDEEVPNNHALTALQIRVPRGFQHPERIWRTTENMEKMPAFCNKARMGTFLNTLCFYFFSGLHYQLGISLFTDTRSSCIRCYEGISWAICIIWCHWGVSCSRWISSRAIYWSVSHKIQKTAVCKVLDRAISLHLLYLKCVKFVESWSKVLSFANTI